MVTVVVCVLVILSTAVHGKPALDANKFAGPCIGMDCLHGILMHGDEHMGEDHGAEDNYHRLKDKLKTGKKDIGPKDAEATFHRVLMHGDKDIGDHHDHVSKEDFVPKKPVEMKPKLANEEFHGVIMHGDANAGRDHSHDHAKLQKTDEKAPDEPKTPDDKFHGVLMHGDKDIGVDHSKEDEKLKFHSVLMHGDKEPGHRHTEEDTQDNVDTAQQGDIGPQDVETLMHGGDKHAHAEVVKPAEDENHAPVGPNPDDLHGILMHGDSELGHDHSLDDAMARQEPAAEFDLEAIKKLGIDTEILRIINLEELLKEDEKNFAEFEKYQEGWSPSSVSDSIFDSIKLLKEKYIYSGEETDDSPKQDKKLLFDAGDDSYDKNQEILNAPSEMHEHEDSTHYLELAGNTDPIYKRHKHFKGSRDREIL